MANHGEYPEMLSAYADGELTEHQSRQIEEHIKTCSECSALLELYREISAAAAESEEPAPAALLTGVMNTLNPLKPPERKVHSKIILTRYMPVAACLVVAMLVWGYFGGFFNLRHDGATGGGAPGMSFDTALSGESEENSMMAPQAVAGAADRSTADLSLDGNSRMLPWDLVNSIYEDPQIKYSDREFHFISNYLEPASQWIVVTGELPGYMSDFKPEPIGPQFGWELVYVIPNDDVPTLLKELPLQQDADTVITSSPGAVLNIYSNTAANSANPGGTFAVVLYSPGE